MIKNDYYFFTLSINKDILCVSQGGDIMTKHNGYQIKKHLTLTETPPFLVLEPGPSIERLNIIFNTGDNFVPNQDEIHFWAIFLCRCAF